MKQKGEIFEPNGYTCMLTSIHTWDRSWIRSIVSPHFKTLL